MKSTTILIPKSDGFSWGEKPEYHDFFIFPSTSLEKKISFVYEARNWDIRLVKQDLYLFKDNECYSKSPIRAINGKYKINFVCFKEYCELQFDIKWNFISVEFYRKNHNDDIVDRNIFLND